MHKSLPIVDQLVLNTRRPFPLFYFRQSTSITWLGLLLVLLSITTPGLAQFTQDGNKLVGTGNLGAAGQGFSVALSADGSTALVGGPNDNGNQGAAWVFTRVNGSWTQQSKLIGTGTSTTASQGYSVALSEDGNTALVGAPNDNDNQGAVLVFTRVNGTWTQQDKLVGTGGTSDARQGYSVAISADGNTALIGGRFDNGSRGAVWVFTRENDTWTQQGNKLVGTGNTGFARQGYAVALSADGNTAMWGGIGDNGFMGAVWVFTRENDAWTQQGNKLVGTASSTTAQQGNSVALSADGNTALVGGYRDNDDQGAVWVFTRTNGTWAQQGNKLVGTVASSTAQQGYSVALSADGNRALVGGRYDNNKHGAVWVYNGSGTWTQEGDKLVGTGGSANAQQAISVALSSDGNIALVGGNGDNSGQGAAWVFRDCSSLTVTITATPSLTITSGNSVTLTASGADSYTWDNGSTDNPLVLNDVTSATTVSVTGIIGSCSATASAEMSVTLAAPDLTASNLTACTGTTISITATCATGSASFTATPAVGSASGNVYTFDDTTPADVYSLSASCVSNGVSSTVVTLVSSLTINQRPSVSISPSTITINDGQSTTLIASGADTFNWNTSPASSNTAVNVSPTQTTVYSVTGTTNGCTDTASATVINCGESIQADATSLTQTAVLGPDNCSVTLKGTGYGNGYTITSPNGYVFSAVYRNAGSYTINGLGVTQPGTYTLTVSYSDACGNTNSDIMTYVVTGTACN